MTQIKVVSAKRLLRKIGNLADEDFTEISSSLIEIIKNETPPIGGESRSPKALIGQ
jgi:hypothetical protein